MSVANFKTNRLLWGWLTALLFCATWIVPGFGKGGETHAALLWNWLAGLTIGEIPLRTSLLIGAFLLAFACIAFLVALIAGWVLQAVLVALLAKRNEPGNKIT